MDRSDVEGRLDSSLARLDDIDASDAALRIVLERLGWFGLGAWVQEGVLLTCGPAGSTGPYAHAVLRVSRECAAERLLTLAVAHARRCGTPVGLWVRSHADADLERAARKAGYVRFGGSDALMGMVAREAPASSDARAAGTVRRAQDPEMFAAVVAAAFGQRGISSAAASALLDNPPLLSAEGSHAFIAVTNGQPVASAIVFVEPPYGALAYIGTIPAARRRGAATEVTVAAMRAAIKDGATRLGLQATPEGKVLYRRLGFAEVTEYPCYLIPPPPVR